MTSVVKVTVYSVEDIGWMSTEHWWKDTAGRQSTGGKTCPHNTKSPP